MKPRFGVHIAAQFGYSYETSLEIALNAEQLGYDLVTIGDHLFLDENSSNRHCLESWMLLCALATQTSKIRLSTLVSANSFRHPSLLPKMAATADVISNGRIMLGLGAGWKKLEYEAYGYEFPTARIRLEQLEEAIQIIRLMWTEDSASFQGKHYTIKDAFCAPKPIQKPHPPIIIGGHGKKHTLRLVAKYADMCNFTFNVDLEINELLDALKAHCKDVGRDYESVEKTFFAYCVIFQEQEELDAYIDNLAKARGMTPEQVKQRHDSMPGVWIGTPEIVREKCERLVDKGFSYFQVRFQLGEDVPMSTLFKNNVARVV